MHANTQTQTHAHIHAHTHKNKGIYSTHTHIQWLVWIQLDIYCTYEYSHTHTCTHTWHTHSHAHTQSNTDRGMAEMNTSHCLYNINPVSCLPVKPPSLSLHAVLRKSPLSLSEATNQGRIFPGGGSRAWGAVLRGYGEGWVGVRGILFACTKQTIAPPLKEAQHAKFNNCERTIKEDTQSGDLDWQVLFILAINSGGAW